MPLECRAANFRGSRLKGCGHKKFGVFGFDECCGFLVTSRPFHLRGLSELLWFGSLILLILNLWPGTIKPKP